MTEGRNSPSSIIGHRSSPLLIIVLGSPGAGKTTVARRIAQDFRLPLVTKDDIKESLFDSLGWRDREWSKQLGRATYDLIYYFVETQLTAGNSLIVESNFSANATPKFSALQAKYDFDSFQILCYANGDVLVERFKQRWASGNRHPGHVDNQLSETEIESIRCATYSPLDLGGTVVEIDTTDFEKIDYEDLFAKLRKVQEKLNEVL